MLLFDTSTLTHSGVIFFSFLFLFFSLNTHIESKCPDPEQKVQENKQNNGATSKNSKDKHVASPTESVPRLGMVGVRAGRIISKVPSALIPPKVDLQLQRHHQGFLKSFCNYRNSVKETETFSSRGPRLEGQKRSIWSRCHADALVRDQTDVLTGPPVGRKSRARAMTDAVLYVNASSWQIRGLVKLPDQRSRTLNAIFKEMFSENKRLTTRTPLLSVSDLCLATNHTIIKMNAWKI